jgi:methionine synthase I (cobalamin-dependent)
MTIEQLIEHLKQYPSDVEVYIINYNNASLDKVGENNIKYHNSHNYIVIGEK